MDKTMTLFPHSHRNDPITSYEAGDKMVESGKLNRQEFQVYSCILYITQYRSDFTAKDLIKGETGYYTIQRRLSGLHRKGKIERTGEKRNGCAVWRLVC